MAKNKGRFTAKAGGKKRSQKTGGKKRRHGGKVGSRAKKFNLMKPDGLMSAAGSVLLGGAGVVLSGVGTAYAAGALPMAQAKTGWGKLAVRAGITAAGVYAVHKFVPKQFAVPLIAGTLAGLGIDLLNLTVMPMLPGLHALSGVAPIEDQLAAIEIESPGALSGLLGTDASTGALFTLN